jgi:hypothetical protein
MDLREPRQDVTDRRAPDFEPGRNHTKVAFRFSMNATVFL